MLSYIEIIKSIINNFFCTLKWGLNYELFKMYSTISWHTYRGPQAGTIN